MILEIYNTWSNCEFIEFRITARKTFIFYIIKYMFAIKIPEKSFTRIYIIKFTPYKETDTEEHSWFVAMSKISSYTVKKNR